MSGILKPILRPILQPVLRSPLGGGDVGDFLASLLTEEGERIQTEESASITPESVNNAQGQ